MTTPISQHELYLSRVALARAHEPGERSLAQTYRDALKLFRHDKPVRQAALLQLVVKRIQEQMDATGGSFYCSDIQEFMAGEFVDSYHETRTQVLAWFRDEGFEVKDFASETRGSLSFTISWE